MVTLQRHCNFFCVCLPLQKNATHGRYVEGRLTLPSPLPEDCLVQLSTAPSSESKQELQPNLLHVTIMNGNERKAAWKSTLTSADWRVRLALRRGRAFLLLPSGEEKPIDCVRDGGFDQYLHLGTGGLLLTIITPLQDGKRGGPDGVRIIDVIKARMEEEPQEK